MTNVWGPANRNYSFLILLVVNVLLLRRGGWDRRTILWIDGGTLAFFVLARAATRMWPDEIWIRGKR